MIASKRSVNGPRPDRLRCVLLLPCLALLLALPWALHRAHAKGEVYDLDELLANFNSESVWKEICFLCLAPS